MSAMLWTTKPVSPGTTVSGDPPEDPARTGNPAAGRAAAPATAHRPMARRAAAARMGAREAPPTRATVPRGAGGMEQVATAVAALMI